MCIIISDKDTHFNQYGKSAAINTHTISPQGLPRPRCRGALGALPLLVLPVLHLHDISGFDGAGHLPADGPQALADRLRDRLHVVRPEVSRQGGEDGLTGSGGVGIGHCDTFRPLPVE